VGYRAVSAATTVGHVDFRVHRHDEVMVEVQTWDGEVVSWLCPVCRERVRPWRAPVMWRGGPAPEPGPVTWLDMPDEKPVRKGW
jgi:hypothetical protein